LGQELFASTEPASTLPKGVFSMRINAERFQEPLGRSKYWTGFRAMYGVLRRFTLIGTFSASNHHLRAFPGNLLYYFRNHHNKVYPAFPYTAEGLNLYGKYRLLSWDGPQRHVRLAFYAEGSKVFGVHDIAEPNLSGDNTGIGGGMILTRLYKRWAVSFTGGYVHPFTLRDGSVSFRSGDLWRYDLSLGYRIFPGSYRGYSDVNINLYAEFFNRTYKAAVLEIEGEIYPNERFQQDDKYTYNTLVANSYTELRYSLQFIFHSKTRIDLGSAFPVYNKSYLNFYPLFFINFQKYLFKEKD
jgi:hypothetical protein